MKSSPLTLGNKKLHAATNLVFDEGVIKTRPGFCYKSLGAEGQFQGACEYRPKEGLSAAVLSEADSGIAVVADGVLWFNCNPISEALFEDAGAVHLYQAENYLILQNPATDTFWWDGLGELVRSPGMNEQDWTEPEVPVFEMEVVAPEADIPDCNLDGAESGINVRFLVLNHNNDKPIASVVWEVQHNKRKAYSGLGGSDGRFAFSPVPRAYTYRLDRAGYVPLEGIPMAISGTGVPHIWDDCLPPTITQVGEYDFVARMKPIPLEKQCLETNQTFIYTDEETIIPNQRRITLTNNEDVPLTLFALTPASPTVTITGPARPVTVAPNETIEFLITGTGDLTGEVLAADMDCMDAPTEIVIGEPDIVYVRLQFAHYADEENPFFIESEDVVMNKTPDLPEYKGTCSRGDITLWWAVDYFNGSFTESLWLLAFDSSTVPIPTQPDTAGPYLVECRQTDDQDISDPSGSFLESLAAPYPHWLAAVSLTPIPD